MKRIDFTHLGKMPFSQDRADYMQQGYFEPFAAIARLCGDKTILYGVEVSGGNVSDGWIAYNGELLFFQGGIVDTEVVINTAITQFTYGDGTARDVYHTKTATCGPVGSFLFNELVPLLELQNIWLPGDIKQKVVDATYEAANFDGSGYGINREKGWRKLSAVYADAAGAVMVNKKDADTEFGVVTNHGGEKAHQLSPAEQGSFEFKEKSDDIGGGTASVTATLNVNGTDIPKGGSNQSSYGATVSKKPLNDATAHNNLQPYFVVLTLMKL